MRPFPMYGRATAVREVIEDGRASAVRVAVVVRGACERGQDKSVWSFRLERRRDLLSEGALATRSGDKRLSLLQWRSRRRAPPGGETMKRIYHRGIATARLRRVAHRAGDERAFTRDRNGSPCHARAIAHGRHAAGGAKHQKRRTGSACEQPPNGRAEGRSSARWLVAGVGCVGDDVVRGSCCRSL